MKVLIAGASGLIGGALTPALRQAGHDVWRLVRRPAAAPDEVRWDPAAGEVDFAGLGQVDAVINLAGENIGAGRWTTARRERIWQSRVDATRTLVAAMTKLPRPPGVWLNASAVGFYGDRGDERLTEEAGPGRGFLPDVCVVWEKEAEAAARAGVRIAYLRFGVVLAPKGGALEKMLPVFKLGLGGRLGSGEQWMSWVSLEDVARAALHVLHTPALSGPVNVVAPEPVRNSEFTRALARQLRRPAVLPVPAWALRLAVGRPMADEALLASTRALPARLQRTAFEFRHPEIEAALRAIGGGKDRHLPREL